MSERINRDKLVQNVAERLNEDTAAVGVMVDAALEEICEALKRGESVSLKDQLIEGDEQRDKAALREKILDELRVLAGDLEIDETEKSQALNYIKTSAEKADIGNYAELLRVLASPEDAPEQELEKGVVNILTMHRAKGLSSKAVIIIAAEEELLPGQSTGTEADDQRRLLYVSLTRAKHHLYITYCNLRYGRQQHTGSRRGQTRRHLTPFLRPLPGSVLRREDGDKYVKKLTC
jgi:superfamily I DNA/RNA helicase